MMRRMEMIRLNEISKVYGTGDVKVEALKQIDLEIKKNEFIGLIGPSGSGKSTLMNIMGCLDTPSSGEYYFEDKNVESFNHNQLAEIRNERIGFVFQNFNLLPYATAFENVELPMLFMGVKTKTRKERTMTLLDKVGLAKRARHKPNELSGGEMQRVAIARSLANNPSLILAVFQDLWRQGHTIVVITHNPNISSRAQRVVKLKDGLIENNGA